MRARDDDTGAGMTSKQLRDEATTLVIAGSETTGNTIAWPCLPAPAQHPQIQERLQEELILALDAPMPAAPDPGQQGDLRCDHRGAAPVQPGLDTAPPGARRCRLGGHLFRAGSRIFFSPYALNRDARLHHDPDRFEPDRWTTDYSRSDMRATFFPFGQGIRNCIGEGSPGPRARPNRRPQSATARCCAWKARRSRGRRTRRCSL